jgi:hypothetical protein
VGEVLAELFVGDALDGNSGFGSGAVELTHGGSSGFTVTVNASGSG